MDLSPRNTQIFNGKRDLWEQTSSKTILELSQKHPASYRVPWGGRRLECFRKMSLIYCECYVCVSNRNCFCKPALRPICLEWRKCLTCLKKLRGERKLESELSKYYQLS